MVDKIKKLFKTEYFWAFVTAGLFALIGFALAGAWPFGEYSVSCSDMRLQFLDLLTGFTQRLKSGGSPPAVCLSLMKALAQTFMLGQHI